MLSKSIGFLCNSFWPYISVENDDYLAFFREFYPYFIFSLLQCHLRPGFAKVSQTKGRKIKHSLIKLMLLMYSCTLRLPIRIYRLNSAGEIQWWTTALSWIYLIKKNQCSKLLSPRVVILEECSVVGCRDSAQSSHIQSHWPQTLFGNRRSLKTKSLG